MKTPLQERLKKWSKAQTNGCVIWTGALDRGGYGRLYVDGKSRSAHRLAYQIRFGEIPIGMHLDHLCRTRACVNPDHLEPVTQAENILRGMAPHVVLHRDGVCAKGHLLTKQPNGRMVCRVCNLASVRRYRQRVAA